MKISKKCPNCRNHTYLGGKNPLIDGVIQLLVDLSLTEKERNDRIYIIQQRPTSSPSVGDEILIVDYQNIEILETFSTAELDFISRIIYLVMAGYFLNKIVNSDEFQKQMIDANEEVRSYIDGLLNTFKIDLEDCKSILNSFPHSLLRRFTI